MQKSKEIASLMKVRSTLKGPSCITKCFLAIICSNSFSHCKVDQKKTVTISQMFNHVQFYVYWLHLLNTRICRYTYVTPTVIYYDHDRCVMKLFNLEMDSTVFKSGVVLTKFGHKLLLYLLNLIMCESVENTETCFYSMVDVTVTCNMQLTINK